MVTARVEYNTNPRFVPDDIPVWHGNSKDSAIIYDATNKEWTVQTTNAAGALQDRIRVKAEQDAHDIEFNGAVTITNTSGNLTINPAADVVLKTAHISMDNNKGIWIADSGNNNRKVLLVDGSDVLLLGDTAGMATCRFQSAITTIDLAGNPEVDLNTGYAQFSERADPAAPSANEARLYAKDNGSGKTQLVVRFPTGAVQVLATEP